MRSISNTLSSCVSLFINLCACHVLHGALQGHVLVPTPLNTKIIQCVVTTGMVMQLGLWALLPQFTQHQRLNESLELVLLSLQ